MNTRTTTDALQIYRELADRYDQLGQAAMRDRFLILSADAALTSGLVEEAERFRQRLLQGSRHHLLKAYGSFAQAAVSPDVQTYISDLRSNYPLETARGLLETIRTTSPPLEIVPPSDTPEPPPYSPTAERWPELPRPAALPPTAPVIDLDAPSTAGLDPTFDDPYATARLPPPPAPAPSRRPRRVAEGTAPSARLPSPAPPADPKPRSQPRVGGPAPAPPPRPRRARPATALPPEDGTPRASGGAWLSVLLGLAALLAGLSLAVFALGKPFWPV